MTRRGRGNPNWIQAAKERRQGMPEEAEAVEEIFVMNTKQEPTIVEAIAQLCAPTMGTIAGTLIVDKAPSHTGVKREYVAVATAVGGLALALNSQGAVRTAAIAMAAQVVAQELLDKLGLLTRNVAPGPAPTEPRQPAASDFITRADLDAAIRKMHDEQRKAIVDAIRVTMAELRPLLLEQQQEQRRPHAERNAVAIEPIYTVVEHSETDDLPSPEGDVSPSENTPDEAKVERMQAVYARLTDEERRKLSSIIVALSPAQSNDLTAQLATAPLDEAVNYVRAVLPTVSLIEGAA